MRIADICTRNVVHVSADISVREAAETMRERHVGALVVVEQPNGERFPIGIATDRDIAISVVAAGIDVNALTIGDVMSRDLATCQSDDTVFAAILTMRERGVRRLPVLAVDGSLAGIVAADDIFASLGAHLSELGRALMSEQIRETRTRR